MGQIRVLIIKSRRLLLFVPLALGMAAFLPFLAWGLPTRQSDAFLFGRSQPWNGGQILKLAAEDLSVDPNRAADVSSKPMNRSSVAVTANYSDSDRARIIRRYRLMSYQPDEFTTFAALSAMKPGRGDLDPRMYKYGGLWVYPVGALLRVASAAGLVRLTPDPAYYLDYPEAFGRFYVVARLYSAVWGMLAIAAVFLLVRRICGSSNAAMWAAICIVLMPVVVTGAHEAKPHLAGTALALWAALAGARYVDRGNLKAAIIVALLCGAAIGMVPSAIPVLLVPPALAILRVLMRKHGPAARQILGRQEVQRAAGMLCLALLVYCLTNPYVPINLIRNRAVLRSNFGNSSHFYHTGMSGVPRGLTMVALGTSLVLGIVGAVGAIALGVRAARKPLNSDDETRRRAAGLLLAAVTLPTGFIFFLFAAGQPADYARFALPFDVFLAIEGVVAIQTFLTNAKWRNACFVFLAMTSGFSGVQYLIGFRRDCRPDTSRTILAAELARRLGKGHSVFASREEPAPWSLPPFDLFRSKIVLPPRNWPVDRPYDGASVTVGPQDFFWNPTLRQLLIATPISWADKPFNVQFSSHTDRDG